jgi:photosystem II stability/assembly factor-like uncharacterized protein
MNHRIFFLLRYSLLALIPLLLAMPVSAQTWTEALFPRGSFSSVVTDARGEYLLATSRGLVRSTDRGASWTVESFAAAPLRAATLVRTHGTILLGTDAGVYRASDAGAPRTWRKTSLPDSVFSELATGPDGKIYAKAYQGDLYRSDDNGLTWQPLGATNSPGDPSMRRKIWQLAIDADGDLLFVGERDTYLRSRDQGRTWTVSSVPGFHDLQGGFRLTIQGTTMYAVGYKTCAYRSTDKGTTWQTIWTPPGDVNRLSVTPAGSLQDATGERHTRYVSEDSGKSWRPDPTPYEFTALHRVAADTLLAVGDVLFGGSVLLRSIDGGRTWATLVSSFSEVTSLLAGPGNDLYAGTGSDGVFRSRDGGRSWAPIAEAYGADEIVRSPGGTLVVRSITDGLFVSTDDGASWLSGPATGVTDKDVRRILATPGGALFAGTNSRMIEIPATGGGHHIAHGGGGLWRSTDDGRIWERVLLDSTFGTDDSGKTWWQSVGTTGTKRNLGVFQPDFSVEAIGLDPEGQLLVHAKIDYREYLFRSTDDGAHWTKDRELEHYAHPLLDYVRTSNGEIFRGIERSTDQGRTFQSVVNGLRSTDRVETVALPNGDVLTISGGTVSFLPAGGNTWRRVGGLDSSMVKTALVHGGQVFVAVEWGRYGRGSQSLLRIGLSDLLAALPRESPAPDVWRPLPRPPGADGLGQFTVTPGAIPTLWATSGEKTLLRSTDAGGHWSSHTLPDRWVRTVAVDPMGSQVLAGSYGGLLRSTDAGATWDTVPFLPTEKGIAGRLGPIVRTVSFGEDGSLLVSVAGPPMFKLPRHDTSITVLSTISLGMSEEEYLYRRDARGNGTWTCAATPWPRRGRVACRTRAGTLLATINGDGIYRSADNGATWSPSNTGLFEPNAFYTCNIGADIDRSVDALVVDRRGVITATRGYGALYASDDDGRTWKKIPAPGTSIWSLALDASGAMYAGTSAGVFRRPPGKKEWTPFSTGLTSSDIFAVVQASDGHVYAASRDGQIFVTIARSK